MYVPWLAKFLLNFPPPKILRESRYRTLEFSENAIQNLSGKEDGHAILYNMIKAVDPETGEKLTKSDILTGTNNLMYTPWIDASHISNAASDTTSVAFTFLLYYLLENRQCWGRLASEIRSKFQSVDEINNHSTLSLQYLDAVIHEGASFLVL
jgi:cytochrome P450